MRLSRAQWNAMVDHARVDAPHECCGLLWGKDGTIGEVERAENKRHSPYGFELTFETLSKANDLDDEGYEIGIYHSHPRSPAEPSQTDINLAQYPHWTWLIVSLEKEEGEIRAWRIADGTVSEEPIEVS
ncbi:MAG: Mov34/MPN/PAD-1 family protein [Thermoleophilaceae bacterium]